MRQQDYAQAPTQTERTHGMPEPQGPSEDQKLIRLVGPKANRSSREWDLQEMIGKIQADPFWAPPAGASREQRRLYEKARKRAAKR